MFYGGQSSSFLHTNFNIILSGTKTRMNKNIFLMGNHNFMFVLYEILIHFSLLAKGRKIENVCKPIFMGPHLFKVGDCLRIMICKFLMDFVLIMNA